MTPVDVRSVCSKGAFRRRSALGTTFGKMHSSPKGIFEPFQTQQISEIRQGIEGAADFVPAWGLDGKLHLRIFVDRWNYDLEMRIIRFLIDLERRRGIDIDFLIIPRTTEVDRTTGIGSTTTT